jgi:hypothetical protein
MAFTNSWPHFLHPVDGDTYFRILSQHSYHPSSFLIDVENLHDLLFEVNDQHPIP